MQHWSILMIVIMICLAGNGQAQTSQQVDNLSQVTSTIQSQSGKAAYLEQINGTLPPNPYQALPHRVDLISLLTWLSPTENPKHLIFSGMKRWQHDQQFIVVACFAWNESAASNGLQDDGYQCAYDYNEEKNNKFYLGVIRLTDDGFIPIAKSDLISTKMANHHGELVTPIGYGYLDLAPYRISPSSMALGLRTQTIDSYAGGGVISQNLVLFHINNQKLDVILNTPIYQLENLAGEWNKDGTRQRHISENVTTVIMKPTQTNGYYDLLLQSGHNKTILKWTGQEYR